MQNSTEKISLSRLSETYKIRFLGMGFLWSWIYCSWFAPALFPAREGIGVNSSSSWFISCIAVMLTLLITPLLFKKSSLHQKRWMRNAQLIIQFVGTILMADGSITHIQSETLHFIGALITGIGCGWLWIMWGELYASLGTEQVEAITPASAVIIPICLVLASNLQGFIAVLVVALLPVISGILLILAFNDDKTKEQQSIDNDIPEHTGKSSYSWSPFFRVGLGSIVIYMTMAFMWALASPEDLNLIGEGFQMPFIAGAVFAIILSISSVLFAKRLNLFSMYRWLLPLLVIAISIFSIESSMAKAFAYTLVTVVQLALDILVWMYYSRVAHQGWQTPAVCLGMSRGFVQVGVVLGNLCGIAAIDALQSGSVQLYQLCFIFICLCVAIVSMLIGWERYWEQDQKHDEQAFEARSEDRESSLVAHYRKLGENAGLSDREQEVFTLLARGRSLPYIRDELYISKNTVETHVKRIYRKLNVHSKQELIDYVEEHH